MSFDHGSCSFCPAPSVSWTDVQTDLVIFDHRTGKYHSLNESASAIWRELIEGRAPNAIIEALVDKFRVTRDEIAPDVMNFLSMALSDGLIVKGDVG